MSRKRIHRWSAALLRLAVVLATLSAGGTLAQNSSQLPDSISVQGTVRNSAGQPVAGATVVLEEKDYRKSSETKTNADGTFFLTVGHAGVYLVKAEKAESHNRDTVVTLSVGEKKQLDLRIDGDKSEQSGSPDSSPQHRPSPARMEFDDKPNFTVAGMTDWNNTGTHGSDVRVRTSEALAKETLALKSNESIESSPTSSENVVKAEAHRRQGELDERRGDPLNAVREYEQAVLLNPSERNYFEWGTELLLHKAPVPAVEVFTKGSAAHRNSSRMLAGLGTALYATGSYDDAALKVCEASDLQPADSAPYLLLGRMEKASAAPVPCSEPRLARFAKDQPENAFANYYYALVLWKKDRGSVDAGRADQVEALLHQAVTIDPKFGEAYVQLGLVKSDRGDVKGATQELIRAIEVRPLLGEAHYRLSLAYKRMGEEAKAHQEFQEYERIQKTEAAAIERERRELRQFLVILKNEPASP